MQKKSQGKRKLVFVGCWGVGLFDFGVFLRCSGAALLVLSLGLKLGKLRTYLRMQKIDLSSELGKGQGTRKSGEVFPVHIVQILSMQVLLGNTV